MEEKIVFSDKKYQKRKVSENVKSTSERIGAFYNRSKYLRWRRIYTIYRRLMNLQQEVCVTFANSAKKEQKRNWEDCFTFRELIDRS